MYNCTGMYVLDTSWHRSTLFASTVSGHQVREVHVTDTNKQLRSIETYSSRSFYRTICNQPRFVSIPMRYWKQAAPRFLQLHPSGRIVFYIDALSLISVGPGDVIKCIAFVSCDFHKLSHYAFML